MGNTFETRSCTTALSDLLLVVIAVELVAFEVVDEDDEGGWNWKPKDDNSGCPLLALVKMAPPGVVVVEMAMILPARYDTPVEFVKEWAEPNAVIFPTTIDDATAFHVPVTGL